MLRVLIAKNSLSRWKARQVSGWTRRRGNSRCDWMLNERGKIYVRHHAMSYFAENCLKYLKYLPRQVFGLKANVCISKLNYTEM